MSGRLVVRVGFMDGSTTHTAEAQHENGQTFYAGYSEYRVRETSLPNYIAEFAALPAGNYLLKKDTNDRSTRKVSIFDGHESEIQFGTEQR